MRTTTIPAYPYVEYQDDDDIQAFFASYNTMAQGYVDFFNQVSLPVYAGNPLIVGELLDWVGQGLYSLPRPSVPLGTEQDVGPLDTYGFAETPDFANLAEIGTVPFLVLPDDYYKRLLTWHHYRGDGRQFSVFWLKRRVARFLYGVNGIDVPLGHESEVSVHASHGVFTVTISPTMASTYAGQVLQALVQASLLALPFQYSFQVTL